MIRWNITSGSFCASSGAPVGWIEPARVVNERV